MKKEQKDGTDADYNLQPIVIPSANLAQNPMLSAAFRRCQIVVSKHNNKKDACVELGKRWRKLINRKKDPWYIIDRIAMSYTLYEIDEIRACFFRYKSTGEFFGSR